MPIRRYLSVSASYMKTAGTLNDLESPLKIVYYFLKENNQIPIAFVSPESRCDVNFLNETFI